MWRVRWHACGVVGELWLQISDKETPATIEMGARSASGIVDAYTAQCALFRALWAVRFWRRDTDTSPAESRCVAIEVQLSSSFTGWWCVYSPLQWVFSSTQYSSYTTVKILMVSSCDSVGTRSWVSGSTIFAGSGQVIGQCVRPGVWPGFVAFAHVLLLLLVRYYATFESVGFCVLCVVYFFTMS